MTLDIYLIVGNRNRVSYNGTCFPLEVRAKKQTNTVLLCEARPVKLAL